MLTINTNLSSMISRKSLFNATFGLNKALERMTTGFKINHSSDNAANYSISESYSSKLSSYNIAVENISQGMDMVNTAQDTISLMQSRGDRLMALWTQAQNGTYGEQSIEAMQAEADAIAAEINRLYNTAEYNGIQLMNNYIMPDWAEDITTSAGTTSSPIYNGFMAEAHTMDDADVDALTHVSELSGFESGKTYAITSKADLKKLAELVNEGNNSSNVTFVMGADIDLGGEEWTPIGNISTNSFKGTFDGNGHVIKNLTARTDDEFDASIGLFGNVSNGNILNIGLVDVNVQGVWCVGALAASSSNTNISNCYSKGNIYGDLNTGGLIGSLTNGTITDCYSMGTVQGKRDEDMFFYGDIGGIVGSASGDITNSFFSGKVIGNSYVGGIAGSCTKSITNCYSEGSVNGINYVGGLTGYSSSYDRYPVTYSYSNCYVTGNDFVGGLVGKLVNAYLGILGGNYSTGQVTGNDYVGGLVGYYEGAGIAKCYSTGDIIGNDFVGGVSGLTKRTVKYDFNMIFIGGNVSGSDCTGIFIGAIGSTTSDTSFVPVNIKNSGVVPNGEQSLIGAEGNAVYNNVTQKYDFTPHTSGQMDLWLAGIETITGAPDTTLQVGINGGVSSQITFNTNFKLSLNVSDIKSSNTYNSINTFINTLSAKATDLGAVSNRLMSALDSASTVIQNLTSSRSTIKDADVAKESSRYIQKQILQQASASLLATANQTPSLALQLI